MYNGSVGHFGKMDRKSSLLFLSEINLKIKEKIKHDHVEISCFECCFIKIVPPDLTDILAV